jgi:hypothetical protein
VNAEPGGGDERKQNRVTSLLWELVMSRLRQHLGPRLRLTGIALVSALLAASPARADIIKFSALLRGVTMTPQQCAALPQAVWVTPSGKGFCIRYYLSTAGGVGGRPVVMIQGDQIGRFNARSGRFEVEPDAKTEDTDTGDLVKIADMLSRRFKGPAIYLARVGTDGSSGFHGIRHSLLELSATDAALEAIKQKHWFEGFHLIGQSGGATLVGGLLALRTDIGCAVPGSGVLAMLAPSQDPDPLAAVIDVAAMIPKIVKSSTARILIVTDPQDEVVPVRAQSTFVTQLRRAGGTAEQFFVEATDEKHHGVSAYAVYAMAACMYGWTDQEIAKGLASFTRERVAAAHHHPDVKADAAATARPNTATARDRNATEASARKPSDLTAPRT